MGQQLNPTLSFKYLVAKILEGYGDQYVRCWLDISKVIREFDSESDYTRQLNVNRLICFMLDGINRVDLKQYVKDGVSPDEWMGNLSRFVIPTLVDNGVFNGQNTHYGTPMPIFAIG